MSYRIELVVALNNFADTILVTRSRPSEEALKLAEEAVQLLRDPSLGSESDERDWFLPIALVTLATALKSVGRWEEASEIVDEGLALVETVIKEERYLGAM